MLSTLVANMVNNSLVSMESALGNPTFTWKGAIYGCIPNTINDSIESIDVGFTANADFRCKVRLNQFTPGIYPSKNDYITYKGNSYQICKIMTPSIGQHIILECRTPNAYGN